MGNERRSFQLAKLPTSGQTSTGSIGRPFGATGLCHWAIRSLFGTCSKPNAALGSSFPRICQRGRPRLFRIIFRDCGELVNVFQTPRQRHLDGPADVKYSHGIETQRLAVQPFCFVNPRKPRNAIALEPTLGELLGDFCQGHVKIACQELDPWRRMSSAKRSQHESHTSFQRMFMVN